MQPDSNATPANTASATPTPQCVISAPNNGDPALWPDAMIKNGIPSPRSGRSGSSRIPWIRKAPDDVIYDAPNSATLMKANATETGVKDRPMIPAAIPARETR